VKKKENQFYDFRYRYTSVRRIIIFLSEIGNCSIEHLIVEWSCIITLFLSILFITKIRGPPKSHIHHIEKNSEMKVRL